FILIGGFLLPIVLLGDQNTTSLAIVGQAPAGLDTALDAAASQYDVTLVLSTVPDQAAAAAALRAKTIEGALQVPADLSGPGQLLVLQDASSRLQGITNAAVVGVRAGASTALLQPPEVVPIQPQSEDHMAAVIFANAGIILMFIGIFTY